MHRYSEKVDKIRDMLAGKSVLVAFSGGVDSTVLAHIAKSVASRAVLLTVRSEVTSQEEILEAERLGKEFGLEHQIIDFKWLATERLAHNPLDRCYECKNQLAAIWKRIAKRLDLEIVAEGTNHSELAGSRPGLQALQEQEILSPFLEAEMTKDEIREYAREHDLAIADKPAMACFATRFPYGTRITEEKIKMVNLVESAVREIFDVRCVRARYHDSLVRIEVGRDELAKLFDTNKLSQLNERAKRAGFRYVTVDIGGYATGSMELS